VPIGGNDGVQAGLKTCWQRRLPGRGHHEPGHGVDQVLHLRVEQHLAVAGLELLDVIAVVQVPVAQQEAVAAAVQQAFSSARFRVYTTTDVVGVEVGGAVKNVIAIAAGVSDGLGYGHSARAALITRGLAEITRLAVRMGANPQTLPGLSGMGDLVLTCTSNLSRNYTVGVRVGRGEKIADLLAGMTTVAEGIRTCRSVFSLAQRLGVEMPIVEQVYALLYAEKPAQQIVTALLTRETKPEFAR